MQKLITRLLPSAMKFVLETKGRAGWSVQQLHSRELPSRFKYPCSSNYAIGTFRCEESCYTITRLVYLYLRLLIQQLVRSKRYLRHLIMTSIAFYLNCFGIGYRICSRIPGIYADEKP